MRHRRLGKAGPISSCIGLGAAALTGSQGRIDPAASMAIVYHAISSGITMFDVSDLGAGSQLEPLIGRALSEQRAEMLLATCQWAGSRRTDGSGRLRRSCDDTLSRFGVDYIDIYYLRVQPWARIENSVAELAELVSEGKIRYIGLVDGEPGQVRLAHAVHPVTVLATEYSLWRQAAEKEHLPVARELGIGIVARSPLGRGLLGGGLPSPEQLDPHDPRRMDPGLSPSVVPDAGRMLREAEAIAADLDIGISRLALAWLLSRNDDVVPVPSAHDPIQLEMNIASTGVELSRETCDRLAEVFSPGVA
ncbi:aldo/keto reductase [Nonomuraea sp. NPDC000554]|uniref:aldo/keto reductase n=1 Tax=Nonomuraea sp. NPDC000554 TaxID=3154259 RepID=UPI003325CFB1